MMINTRKFSRTLALGVMVMVAMMYVAHVSNARADDDDDEDTGHRPAIVDAKWASECSACHVAYPARYLPADSWRAIMAGLDKHFGSNASLDPATAKEITAYLEKNASTRRHHSGKPVLRITETRWWRSEHREIAARHWKNPKVKSRADCEACHTTADKGDFSERHVKFPR
ncbi:MAG TPA: diheme cytochrome c [Gallionella sp.]|nr:diheme cytochrome c [Gallionella sp.]